MTSTSSLSPQLSFAQRQENARAFVRAWEGRGYEKGDTATFWNHLLSTVVGMEDITTNVRYETRAENNGFIDVVMADAKTIVEQKALGIDLDKPEPRQGTLVTPFQQALRYANSLPNSQRPDYIIVSNFNQFRIHSLNEVKPETNYLAFDLAELPEQFTLLDFLTDPQRARYKREEQVSMAAGQLIGKLYDLLRKQFDNPDTEDNQHALNVLCVRLVFCLFAEDAGLFGKDAFYKYLAETPAKMARGRLKDLFAVLDQKLEDRTDPYMDPELKAFPYVNGGLFRGQSEIPPFTDEIMALLTEEVSRDTNWAQISPTIFGGVFESTLNPETRAKGGMHYTSPENIHKVIDPLFLDDLKAELKSILDQDGTTANKKKKQLEAFHEKLAGLSFFDPACGSGNFLTETYVQLRRIENKVLSELMANQTQLGFEETSPLKVSLDQFYGIEINDFAVSVASTALWIAQLQANIEAQTIITQHIEDLPLHDAAHIVQGNALRTDWAGVLDPKDCNYIIGNPPFLGARNQSKEQKADLQEVFPKGTKNVGNIDYVAGWFIKAAEYMGNYPVRAALVATNSIVQGEQVANIWYPITQLGAHIDFAHDTFRWANEASDQAHVFCVIVGFSKQTVPVRLFHHATPDAPAELRHPERLNPYLADAPDIFVWSRSKPLCDVPAIAIGNKPIDGGHYLFKPEEKLEFIAREPYSERFFRPWVGGQEFIQGKKRWVLWLGEATATDFKNMPLAREKVQAVAQYRAESSSAPTRKIADTPTRFHVENMPKGNCLVIPQVSSQRRRYIPLGFSGPGIVYSDKVRLMPDATLYDLGVLHSQFHNAWMRVIGVRLKSDYSYSNSIVYNNFVWPDPTPDQRAEIERLAEDVLKARDLYEGESLAELYDPDNDFLHPVLVKAHRALDQAVEAAYGVDFSGMDEGDRELAIVSHLFELYNQATQN